MTAASGGRDVADTPMDLRDPKQRDSFRKLLQKAREGDKRATEQAREVLEAAPALWGTFPSVSRAAEEAYLRAAGGDDAILQEAWQRQLKRLQDDLAGSNP